MTIYVKCLDIPVKSYKDWLSLRRIRYRHKYDTIILTELSDSLSKTNKKVRRTQ